MTQNQNLDKKQDLLEGEADEALDLLQDQLVADAASQELADQKMRVDNRSIFTIRDQIAKDDPKKS